MNILIPVDFSSDYNSAVSYASSLPGISTDKIYLFHVAMMPDFYVSELEDYGKYESELKSIIKKIHDSSLSKLREIKAKHFDKSSKVICKVIISKNVYKEIIHYSETLKCDLIIINESDTSRKIKIGSNTERVVRLSNVPVMVMKNLSKSSVKKVVFASDFRSESVPVFSKLLNCFQTEYISFRLLYINTKSDFEEYDVVKDRMEKFKKNFAGDFSIVIRAGKSVETSIVKYANSINADIIAMGIKNKKGFSLYFTGRITEAVISLSELPVLVTNDTSLL
ncbi:MAG: universal stress protein [Candidatus Kapaibacterium sp.]